jgi:hypothetical protein
VKEVLIQLTSSLQSAKTTEKTEPGSNLEQVLSAYIPIQSISFFRKDAAFI